MDLAGAMLSTAAIGGATLRLAPLGVSLRLELRGAGPAAVMPACHGWEGAGGAALLELVLTFDPALSGVAATEVVVHGRQLVLAGAGVRGGACADRQRAWCAVSADFLDAPGSLRSEVLDPLVLFLVARHGRTPLHSAAIRSGELAILLMGPSGGGKSSLALAADRAGWSVLAEDTVYVQGEPALKVWGSAGPVHLCPTAELPAPGQVRIRNGKLKQIIPLRQPSGALIADRATVCLLARGDAVALDRLGPSEALTLMGPPEPGFDLLAGDIRAASELLVSRGAWRLALSADPAEAIAFLSANLPLLHCTAVP